MKRLILLICILFSLYTTKGQGFPNTDSLRTYNIKYITNNAATAFTNLRLHTLMRGVIDWIDTARAGTGGGGAIGIDTLWALNDSTIRYRKSGVFRNAILRGVYDTRRKVDTAYALNDSTLQIKINGTNRNIIIPGRHWNLQGILNNGSTLTENETITLADSLTFTSGLVIIESLNLPSLVTEVDTTANKPLVIDASGNVHKMAGWPGSDSGSPGGSNTQIQYNNSGTFAGDAGLTYDDALNKLTTDSARTIRAQSDTIISAVLPNYTGDSLYVLADSYGNAVGATNSVFGWPTLLTGWMGAPIRNFSVSASTLMKRTPVDPYGFSNLIDRLGSIPTFGPKKGWIVIAYGFNDMGQNSANYTPANFRLDYQTVIDDIIGKGWPMHRIILVAPYYASSDTYATYATITGTTANTRQRHNAFIDTVQATASFNGTKFVNPMTAQLNNDSTYLMANDFVHANNWGHAVIAQAIYSTITDTVVRDEQTLAINGKTELQNLYLKNQDSIHFLAPVLGLGFNNKVGFFNNNRILRSMPLNMPQAGNLNIIGKALVGNVTTPTAVEVIQANGMIKGVSLRATGSSPSGLTGTGGEIAYTSGTFQLFGYDRDGAAGRPMALNSLGGVVMVNTTTPSGGDDELLQVASGGINSKFGRFTGFLTGSGYAGMGAEIGVASSTAVLLGYDRTAGSGINLNLGFGLSPFVIVGSNTVTGSAGFQVNPKTYHADEVNIGSSTDQGSYTLQNTGGLYQNGSVSLNLGSDANYDIYYRNSSGLFTRLAAATDGYVLTTHSTSSAPTWEAPSSGGDGIYGGSGSLPSSVTISTAGHTLEVTGSNDSETSFSVTNTGTTNASAIAATANGTTSVAVSGTSGSYIGVLGNSTSNNGVQGQSSSGTGVIGVSSTGAGLRGQNNPASNNAIANVLTLLTTTSAGAGANGLGAAIQYELETATSGTSQIAGTLAFKWTDATNATRTSAFEIYGVNSATSARKAALAGNGQWTWDTYGAGTHTGTLASYIVSTSAGAIVEQPASTIPIISSGAVAPATTPGKVGDIYIDTSAKKLYFATGTSSSADWTISN